MKQISGVLDEVLRRLNTPESAVQKVGRINEVSSHLENLLRELMSATPGLNCVSPARAKAACSVPGYPDLRIVDTASQRVFSRPKAFTPPEARQQFPHVLFRAENRDQQGARRRRPSCHRFEHETKAGGSWTFTRWNLVDLARFKVRLKAEFQGSNNDYLPAEAIIATSAK